uniref:Uncharacterized protein n=1 Tax=Ciona intestinalis TaxID=7719 RepID=H2XR24_CIOIN
MVSTPGASGDVAINFTSSVTMILTKLGLRWTTFSSFPFTASHTIIFFWSPLVISISLLKAKHLTTPICSFMVCKHTPNQLHISHRAIGRSRSDNFSVKPNTINIVCMSD